MAETTAIPISGSIVSSTDSTSNDKDAVANGMHSRVITRECIRAKGVENAAEFKNAKRHAADLRSACREGKFEQACRSLAAIERLSEGNGNLQIDEPDDEGETALTLALINGHASIVDSLLEKGADSTHCANDNTPLPVIRAAALGHAECVSVLRQHNPAVACYLNEATIPSGPLAGHTALSVAAMHGHHLVVHELLSADPVADVHNGPYHGAALLEAAMRGHGLVLELLLSHGCDPDCHRGTGRVSAMQHAINAKQWLICALLATYGASLEECRDEVQLREIIACAIFLEHDDTTEWLLDRGEALNMDLDAELDQGCTLVTAAVACSNLAALRLLLARGASANRMDAFGNTPVTIAVALGHCDAVKRLLASGADIEACAGTHGKVPLQIAVQLWFRSVQEAGVRHGLGVLGFEPDIPSASDYSTGVSPRAVSDDGARGGGVADACGSSERSDDSSQVVAWTPEPRHVFRHPASFSKAQGVAAESTELSVAVDGVTCGRGVQSAPLRLISDLDCRNLCGASGLMEEEACRGPGGGWSLRGWVRGAVRMLLGLCLGQRAFGLPEMGTPLMASSESAMAAKLGMKRRVKAGSGSGGGCLGACWGWKASKPVLDSSPRLGAERSNDTCRAGQKSNQGLLSSDLDKSLSPGAVTNLCMTSPWQPNPLSGDLCDNAIDNAAFSVKLECATAQTDPTTPPNITPASPASASSSAFFASPVRSLSPVALSPSGAEFKALIADSEGDAGSLPPVISNPHHIVLPLTLPSPRHRFTYVGAESAASPDSGEIADNEADSGRLPLDAADASAASRDGERELVARLHALAEPESAPALQSADAASCLQPVASPVPAKAATHNDAGVHVARQWGDCSGSASRPSLSAQAVRESLHAEEGQVVSHSDRHAGNSGSAEGARDEATSACCRQEPSIGNSSAQVVDRLRDNAGSCGGSSKDNASLCSPLRHPTEDLSVPGDCDVVGNLPLSTAAPATSSAAGHRMADGWKEVVHAGEHPCTSHRGIDEVAVHAGNDGVDAGPVCAGNPLAAQPSLEGTISSTLGSTMLLGYRPPSLLFGRQPSTHFSNSSSLAVTQAPGGGATAGLQGILEASKELQEPSPRHPVSSNVESPSCAPQGAPALLPETPQDESSSAARTIVLPLPEAHAESTAPATAPDENPRSEPAEAARWGWTGVSETYAGLALCMPESDISIDQELAADGHDFNLAALDGCAKARRLQGASPRANDSSFECAPSLDFAGHALRSAPHWLWGPATTAAPSRPTASFEIAPSKSRVRNALNSRLKQGVRFRIDGDMGMVGCVQALFEASRDPCSVAGEPMLTVLQQHGVLQKISREKVLLRKVSGARDGAPAASLLETEDVEAS